MAAEVVLTICAVGFGLLIYIAITLDEVAKVLKSIAKSLEEVRK